MLSTAVQLQRVRQLAATGEARRIRQAARLSLRDISPEVGADPSTILRWEKGETRPTGTAALRWLELLEHLSQAAAA